MPNTLVWTVVRADNPKARAVEPGLAGVNIPTRVHAWAAGHGLGSDDLTHLLVATKEDDATLNGQIAWMETDATDDDYQAVKQAVAEENAE